jgi:TolB-like protein
MVSNALEWPHLIVRILTLALLLGLPLVATLAWYQGHRAQRRVSGAELAIITVLLVLAGTALWHFSQPTKEPTIAKVLNTPAPTAAPASPVVPPPAAKSIAVLPFADMSEKKDQEYFADGMAEEIINILVQVPELFVPARTSSFYFKGKPTQIPEIARALHVANVLEGSVRKAGNQLRITTQLIRAADGYHVWSRTYDRELKDVFKVQDEIANAVAQALQIGLMGGPLTRQKGGTENLVAYQLYLRAINLANEHTDDALNETEKYLEKAIESDSDFALAWADLAITLVGKTEAGLVPQKVGWEKSRALAQHAIALAPDSAWARSTLAYVFRTYDWDWAAADAEYERALRLEPTNVDVLYSAGIHSATMGRWDDAIGKTQAAVVRDPLHTYALLNLGTAFHGAGRFAEAERAYRRLIRLSPDFVWARYYLSKTLLAQEKRQEALAVNQQELTDLDRTIVLPIMLWANGRKTEGDSALKELIEKYASTNAYFIAMNYAYRGDRDLAFQWLDRAYQQHEPDLTEILSEHLFKGIAGDPRFQAFLRRMNLPTAHAAARDGKSESKAPG